MTIRPFPHAYKIIFATIAISLGLLGLWLRWQFVTTVHLYPDEFVTLLAIRMIGETGLPLMPSGLFYEHGLLYSYLGYVATWFGSPRLAVRLFSLLCGGLTLGLTVWLGSRWFSPAAGLLALAGLAIAPVAIHWSGRARMYALLQLLVLLALWWSYQGLARDKARLRWLALLAYLGATLTHFVAVALAPPLLLGAALLLWLRAPSWDKFVVRLRQLWPELLACGGVLLVAFLVKRAGQPKGIDPLDPSPTSALTGLGQVFAIYSDFSFDPASGWQAIAPFYQTLPALLFVPFALLAIVAVLRSLFRATSPVERRSAGPTLFLASVLILTTLEMILLVSPDRRDDKYLFMLLPVLLILGGHGFVLLSTWLARHLGSQLNSRKNERPGLSQPSPISVNLGEMLRHKIPPVPPKGGVKRRVPPFGGLGGQKSATNLATSSPTEEEGRVSNGMRAVVTADWLLLLLVAGGVVATLGSGWPAAQRLLANTGDDYDAAFAYVREQWQPGDKIMTGTPAAAAFYLDRNDFYSVQRRGGYDYRILTVDDQAVDRWLASPAIRTEAALNRVLAAHDVWLVLERWGLQREYYDLPFQQQLLAQTDYVSESQGIFILRSKDDPQPIQLQPAQPVEAAFGDRVRLLGYTLEPPHGRPGQSLRLTLYWQALQPMAHDYTVFVHVRRPDGPGNLTQADHRPLGSLYPTSLWPVGETIRETSRLHLPADIAPGRYELWAGLYLLETGQRLPLQNDTSGENAVRLGILEVENLVD